MLPFLDVPRPRFNPARLPGLAAWYDAADSSTVLTTVGPDVPATNGQTVRRWLSRHNPAVYFDQGTLANQPTFTNATTGLTFNGTSSFMDGTATMAGIMRNKSYGYIFAVAQDTNLADAQSNHRIVYFGNAGTGTQARAGLFSKESNNTNCAVGGRRLDADSFVKSTSSSSVASVGLVDGAFSWATGALQCFVNGTGATPTNFSSGAGSSSDTNSFAVNLGNAQPGPADYITGNIREIIVCNEQLTAAQILATRRYLQRKWGTPALP